VTTKLDFTILKEDTEFNYLFCLKVFIDKEIMTIKKIVYFQRYKKIILDKKTITERKIDLIYKPMKMRSYFD
jgi:hypothetical protein